MATKKNDARGPIRGGAGVFPRVVGDGRTCVPIPVVGVGVDGEECVVERGKCGADSGGVGQHDASGDRGGAG